MSLMRAIVPEHHIGGNDPNGLIPAIKAALISPFGLMSAPDFSPAQSKIAAGGLGDAETQQIDAAADRLLLGKRLKRADH